MRCNNLIKFALFILLFISNALCFDLSKYIQKIDNYVAKSLDTWNVPGAAIGIVQNGKVIFYKTYGVKQLGKHEKIDEHTTFCLASVSKNITAFLLQKLVDCGKIRWEDKVIKYLPDFYLISPEITNELTIEDIVSHRCGLKHFSGDSLVGLGFSRQEIIDALSKLPHDRIFRVNYTYQNQIFGLSSLIIEKVCGKSIDEVMKEYIFSPLEMSDSSCGMPKKPWFSWFFKNNMAIPHAFRGGKLSAIKLSKDDYIFETSTGVNSSLHDMVRFLQFVLSKEPNKEIIWSGHTKPKNFKVDDKNFPSNRIKDVSYCIGSFKFTFKSKDKEITVFNQMGAMPGWRNLIFFVPEQSIGVIFMSNSGPFSVNSVPEAIQNFILDIISGDYYDWNKQFFEKAVASREKQEEFEIREKITNPIPPLPLERYSGKFHNDIYGDIVFEVKSKTLYMNYRGKSAPLKHRTASAFEFKQEIFSEHVSNYFDPVIYFDQSNPKTINSMEITFMNEGKDPTFKRVG